jgi:hypothetical protein
MSAALTESQRRRGANVGLLPPLRLMLGPRCAPGSFPLLYGC